MKIKETLKDKYNLLMFCSVIVTILWVYANLNTCFIILDQMIMIIYAMGFMLVPYIIRHYHLLDKVKDEDFDGGRYWLSLFTQKN